MKERRQCVFGRLWRWFLTVLGDIKVYKFPMFMVYDPTTFAVKGDDTRDIMDVIAPGDVVLRGYRHYLDGFFIPGDLSHSGIYVGNGTVIHSVAEGVCEIDLIDFFRCDRACVMRPKDGKAAVEAIEKAKSLIGSDYDFNFVDGNGAYYCHEFTATCYSMLGIEKKKTKIMGIPLRRRYLGTSFTESDKFEEVIRVNC